MNWRSYLRTKSRQPEFLWRMVLWILAAGVLLGYVAQQVTQPQPPGRNDHVVQTDIWKQLDIFGENGQWRELWWAIPRVAYSRFAESGPTALAALTWCCWMAFLLQALQVRGPSDLRVWLALLAAAAGVVSIWPTHFISLWQKYAWNIHASLEFVQGLRFYILGVGLPEELSKLLCLMPLLLLVRGELAALLVSACVGLGFAATENVGYFAGTGGTSAMGRFLVANPMHFTLTGLVGLHVFRALRDPAGWGPHAAATFGLMVVAHGVYDAAITVPALAQYALINVIVFALVVYQFFRELRDLRARGDDLISLSANFLVGVSLITAATFVYLSATVGCSVAFDSLVQGVLGLAVMVYLFLREMPDTMVSV